MDASSPRPALPPAAAQTPCLRTLGVQGQQLREWSPAGSPLASPAPSAAAGSSHPASGWDHVAVHPVSGCDPVAGPPQAPFDPWAAVQMPSVFLKGENDPLHQLHAAAPPGSRASYGATSDELAADGTLMHAVDMVGDIARAPATSSNSQSRSAAAANHADDAGARSSTPSRPSG